MAYRPTTAPLPAGVEPLRGRLRPSESGPAFGARPSTVSSLPRLPTSASVGALRTPTTGRAPPDLRLPSREYGSRSTISGFTADRNAVVERALRVLSTHGAGAAAPPTSLDLELYQKKRTAAFGKAMSDVANLMELKAAQWGERVTVSGSDASAAKEEERRRAVKAREKSERLDEEAAAARAQFMRNSTATGRVNARLEALRADDALVAELQARVDSYRAQRSDGKAEKKSFIRRNRRAPRRRCQGGEEFLLSVGQGAEGVAAVRGDAPRPARHPHPPVR